MARGIPSDSEHERNLAKMRERNKPTPKAEKAVADALSYQERLNAERAAVEPLLQDISLAVQITAHMAYLDVVEAQQKLGMILASMRIITEVDESLKQETADGIQDVWKTLEKFRKALNAAAKLPPGKSQKRG